MERGLSGRIKLKDVMMEGDEGKIRTNMAPPKIRGAALQLKHALYLSFTHADTYTPFLDRGLLLTIMLMNIQ